MEKQRQYYIWHRKQFDLIFPLMELQKMYGDTVEVTGIITADSVCTPSEVEESYLGVSRVSSNRTSFYETCVADLTGQYATQKRKLIVSKLRAAEFFKGVAASGKNIEVWYFPLAGSEEALHLNEIEQNLPKGAALNPFADNTIISESELPFSLENVPDTFSSFRKKIEKQPYTSYAFSKYPENLPADDSRGRKRLEEYIFTGRKILNYKKTRNGLGPGDYSSRMSKWLSAGTIRAAEIGSAVLAFEENHTKNESTYWLIFELLWRDYFFYLHKRIGNLLFAPSGMKKRRSPGLVDNVFWEFPKSNYTMQFQRADKETLGMHWSNFRLWVLGKTGNSFVDTMMKELFFTGEISNRARQCAASYLIHDLHIPWWWGAQWFEYLLVDYDVSSNWGNWAYIAGVGADPRPVRKFNMKIQREKYDPCDEYVNWGKKQHWTIPEDALPEKFPGIFV